MDTATRAEELIDFLFDRAPSPAERESIAAFGFDCDTFLINLLCSDDAAERYGDIAQHLIDHVRAEIGRDMRPHKLAHDLALSKEDLEKLQAKLDHFNGQLVDLLKHEDRVAGLFDTARDIQSQFNVVRQRIARVEASMLQGVGTDDDP